MRSATVPRNQRATLRCFSSRPARGIWPYATSRINACQNVYSVWPSRAEVRLGRTSSRRSTSASRSWTDGSSQPQSAASAPDQKTLPTTAASCRSALSSCGSWSSREPINACSDSGTGMSCSSATGRSWLSRSISPRSTSSWMNSSANSGFPPERSIRTDWVDAGSTARSSSDETSTAVSLSVSGGSAMRIALRRPSPHCG